MTQILGQPCEFQVSAGSGTSWLSWDSQLTCSPSAHHHPASLEELQSAIASSPSVRVCANLSHSYSPIATADGARQGASVSLDRLCLVTVDQEQGTVTAEAGATVSSIHIALERVGRALPFTTALAAETIGGCVAAGTHGVGRRYGLLASLVISGTLVLPDGSIVTGTATAEPLVRASRVGLGLLGVWYSLTLRTVPAFQLVKRVTMIDAAATFFAERVSETLLEATDSVQWFVYPATSSAKTYTRSIATAADAAALPRCWNEAGTGATTAAVSCDAGYRSTSYPAAQWAEWGKQTESEYFLPQATAIDVAKAFIESVAEEDKGRFFLFGRYVAAGDHLLGPNQVDSVALTFVVPHDETNRGGNDERFNALHAPFEVGHASLPNLILWRLVCFWFWVSWRLAGTE